MKNLFYMILGGYQHLTFVSLYHIVNCKYGTSNRHVV